MEALLLFFIHCGYTADEIYILFKKYGKKLKYIDWKNVFKIIWGVIAKRQLIITGFKSGEIIEKTVNKVCDDKNISNISQIKMDLLIPAVDSFSGKIFVFNSCNLDYDTKNEKYISSGDIGKIVRSSCSYPVMFSPCNYEGTELLDGGIKENIPWNELKEINCEKIFSIGFENIYKKKCCENIIETAERSFELMCEELNRHELNRIDFLHKIKLKNVSLLEIEKMDKIYEEGYKQTKEKMKYIKEYLDRNSNQ